MKKLKWGLLACLTVASSVIPVLSTTACGKKTEEVNKIGAEYDKEYGVDQAVYTKMKNEFWNKREMDLRRKGADAAEIERKRQDLNETFREYDNQLASMQLSYTAVTNAMVDFASQMYGIKLTRQTSKKTATWDDLTAAFEGMVQSMNQYMIGSNVPTEQRATVIQKAREDFVGNGEELDTNPGLLPRLKAQYDDPLSGLIKGKAELLACFSEMNYDIGLFAASERLRNFMEDYEITYDKKENEPKEDQSNKLDNLEKNSWFKVGADLSVNSNILKIYTITRKVDGKVLETFDSDKVCPSYTVKPILKKINKNARTNSYTLDIDWTCVKTAYLQSNDLEKVEKTTAHFFKPDPNKIRQETNITSAYDTLKKCNEESTLSYPITLTKAGEKKAIEETYFNQNSEDGYISLGWDTNPSGDKVNAFDALFNGIPLKDSDNNEGGYEYLIYFDSLAQSGLTISYNNATRPERQTDQVRVDDLMAVNGTKSKSSVELFENQDQLVKDFMNNCTAWADTATDETRTNNSGEYAATSSVYIDYKNTEYEAAEQFKGPFTSYCAIENKEVDNYNISTNSYDNLVGAFNTQEDFVSDYKINKYKDQYESAKTMSIVEGSFLTLTLLGCGLTIAKCAAPAFIAKLPIYIVIILLAVTGTITQIAMMSLNVDRKTRPLERFVDKLESIKNSQEIDDFEDELIQSANKNYLPRYDKESHTIKQADYEDGYHKFMDNADFFEDVLPAMEYYQNISQQPSFLRCYDIIEENDVDPETYLNTMETWDKDGACTITYWTLFGATLALNIAVIVMLRVNPELSDWTAMKVAEAKARQSGQASESVVQTYKDIMKAKESLKEFKKIIAQAEYLNFDVTRKLRPFDCFSSFSDAQMFLNGSNMSRRIRNCLEVFSRTLSDLGDNPTLLESINAIKESASCGETGASAFIEGLTKISQGAREPGERLVLHGLLDSVRGAMDIATKGAQASEKFYELGNIANLIKNLNPAAQTALDFAWKTAQSAVKAGDFRLAAQLITNMDYILYDASNLVKGVLGDAAQTIDLYSGLTESFVGIFKRIYETMRNFMIASGQFTVI